MNHLRALACLALLSLCGWARGAEFTGKVIAVLDGDTLMVMQGSRPLKVRLAEIDAPEKSQPYGTASQQSLAQMVMGKQIQVVSRAIDDYGRMVAMLSVDGLNVNHEQVRHGMAWEYSRYHSNKALMALQREAQLARRGLWAGEEITEPSQWRKLHPAAFAIAPPSSTTTTQRDHAAGSDSAQGCTKKYCSQMASCEEARDYLARCHTSTLDGDGDGIPCESLCAPPMTIMQ